MRAPETLREAVARRVLRAQPANDALAVAEGVVRAGGASVEGVLFFGSRKSGAGPNSWSAFDLFVLTREYRGFYRALAASGALRRSPLLVRGLNHVLPPNQVSITVPREGGDLRAKCAV